MIVSELLNDGTLIKHYSDSGKMMLQVETGIKYGEAVDVVPCRYTYEETDEYIDIKVNEDEFESHDETTVEIDSDPLIEFEVTI